MATVSSYLRLALGICAATVFLPVQAATTGLDSRAPIPAYLGTMPQTDNSGVGIPLLLSQTGAFANTPSMIPHAGLVPYALNAPLWSDNSRKIRWLALPFDGTPGSAGSPTIGNHPTGKWSFPNGTVIVKHFEMVVNEQTNLVRRLETRLLVRDADGGVYGRSYRWRDDNTDADLIPENATTEQRFLQLTMTRMNGSTDTQTWNFPRPSECLQCHNNANPTSDFGTGMVLGLKTRHMNGDFGYPAPGRTANQLNTLRHLGMLGNAIPEADSYPQFDKAVPLDDPTATLEHKVRSYVDNNCGFCHGGSGSPGPIWDARFSTPLKDQNIAGDATLTPFAVLRRFDTDNSRMYLRDAVDPRVSAFPAPMPPLARNIPHTNWLNVVSAWVNYPFDTTSAVAVGNPTQIRLKFDRALDPATATNKDHYGVTGSITVSAAALNPLDASEVFLTVSPMTADTSYRVTVVNVKESGSQSGGVMNPIWPNTWEAFTYLAAPIVQTINFPALPDKFRGDAPFTAMATGGPSGNPVVFTSLTPLVCTASGLNGSTIVLTGAPGLCTLAANQAGNATHDAAAQVTRSFKVFWRVPLVFEGSQQVSPVVTQGSGSGTATYDATTRVLALDAMISGLSSTETMAHIHGPAARGANAGVLIDLNTGNNKVQNVTLTTTQEAQLLTGQLYINIHTVNFPGGEVRAQLDALGSNGMKVLKVVANGSYATINRLAPLPAATVCSGAPTCAGATFLLPQGSTVSLAAIATAGQNADVWTGVWSRCDGQTFAMASPGFTDATCDLVLNQSREVVATFATAGVPSEPRNIQVNVGDGFATFTFDPPASDRGSPVTGYTITCTESINTSTISGTGSPLGIALANGHTYQCTLRANSATGNGTESAVFSISPRAPIRLMNVHSRKTHIANLPFASETIGNLPVTLDVPLSGNVTIEPRIVGPRGHQVVFTFDRPITNIGTVTARTADDQSPADVSHVWDNNNLIVTLSNLKSESFKTIIKVQTINGFATDNAQVTIGFLPGDINASGRVSAADMVGLKVKIASGESINSGDNFKFDINLDSKISHADLSALKGRAGRVIP